MKTLVTAKTPSVCISSNVSLPALELEPILSSTGPSFPILLLSAVPALSLKLQMTHPPCLLTEAAVASPGLPHPPPWGPPPQKVHPRPHQGTGPSLQVGLIRVPLTELPWQLPGADENKGGGTATLLTFTGVPPASKGHWLPHQLHHSQSPSFTVSFFCSVVNLT